MKRHIIVFYFTPTVPPVDVFVFCFLLFCFFSLLIVSKKGNTLLQLTGFEYLITFLLRRLPTTEPLRRPFPRPADDSRRLPTTSDDLLPHLHHNGCWIDPCYYSSSRWNDSSRCPVQVMSFQSMLSASRSQQLSSRVFKKMRSCVRSQNYSGFPVFVLSDLK